MCYVWRSRQQSAVANQPSENRGKLAIDDHVNSSLRYKTFCEKNRPGVTLGGVREELEEGDSGPKHLRNTSKLGATVSPDGGKGVTAAVVYRPRVAIGGVREELEVQPWACAVVLSTRCRKKKCFGVGDR